MSEAITKATPITPRTSCAVHTERDAHSLCARCGNFLCTECDVLVNWSLDSYCPPCAERLRSAGDRIPWESDVGGFYFRFWETAKEVLGAPTRFFSRLAPQNLVPAITFQ